MEFRSQTLYAPRAWSLFLLFSGSALTCAGVFLGPLGWLAMLFFGAATAVAAYRSFFPHRLTLDVQGIAVSGRLTRWDDIDEFGVSYNLHSVLPSEGRLLAGLLLHPTRVVGYRLRNAGQVLSALSILEAGYHVTLPSNFGRSPEEFAAELNRWRLHFSAAPALPRSSGI